MSINGRRSLTADDAKIKKLFTAVNKADMKTEIKDKSKNITRALNLLGINVNAVTTDLILNVAEYVGKKEGETTISDLVLIEKGVKSLYEIDESEPEDKV